jgi:hypothetical protein
MTDKPDQLEHECGEWLSDWDIDFKDIVQLDEFKKSLATFIRQREDKARDEERKRCVEVVVDNVLRNMENIIIERRGSKEETIEWYYTRLLSVEVNTEEVEK